MKFTHEITFFEKGLRCWIKNSKQF